MAKVRIRVSGCFRTQAFGEAYARLSSYLQSMAALGYNPLAAIQIALVGNAVETLKLRADPERRLNRYRQAKFETVQQGPFSYLVTSLEPVRAVGGGNRRLHPESDALGGLECIV